MPVEAVTAPATAKVPKFIKFETSSFAAHITLNHPPYNVLNVPLMTELAEAIESLNGRGEIKCIVLDAVQDPKVPQKMFSAGISLEDSQSDRVFQTLDTFNRIFQAIREISKPLVVVVNGQAVGAGSELVAVGAGARRVAFRHLVIATPNAKFLQPEVKMGVFPPFAAMILPALIGPKK